VIRQVAAIVTLGLVAVAMAIVTGAGAAEPRADPAVEMIEASINANADDAAVPGSGPGDRASASAFESFEESVQVAEGPVESVASQETVIIPTDTGFVVTSVGAASTQLLSGPFGIGIATSGLAVTFATGTEPAPIVVRGEVEAAGPGCDGQDETDVVVTMRPEDLTQSQQTRVIGCPGPDGQSVEFSYLAPPDSSVDIEVLATADIHAGVSQFGTAETTWDLEMVIGCVVGTEGPDGLEGTPGDDVICGLAAAT
jgi:hypothetical protein